MKEKIKNKNLQKFSGKSGPWDWIDEDTVRIQGLAGSYIVNFNCIDWISKDIKKHIHISSEISQKVKELFSEKVEKEDKKIIEYIRNKSLLHRPFVVLSWSEKGIISKDFTEKQKNIFKFITSNSDITIDKIIEGLGLSEEVVKSDVKKIMGEIAKVKPEFKAYYKTPCYLPEIRKRKVIKPKKPSST